MGILLEDLNDDDKTNFLVLLLYVIYADGEVSDGEQEIVKKIANKIGITIGQLNATSDHIAKSSAGEKTTIFQLACKYFYDHQNKETVELVFKVLMKICFSDSVLDDKEKDMVEIFRKSFKISSNRYVEILQEILEEKRKNIDNF